MLPTILQNLSLLLVALTMWLGIAKVLPLFLRGEEGFMRLLQQSDVDKQWAASSQKFAAKFDPPSGLLRGFVFEITGTSVTDSALNDDAPWTLIANLQISLPLKKGTVVINTTGRDAFLVSRYLTGKLHENQTAATAGVFFSSFFLPFGPDGWGIHKDDFDPAGEILVTGTWAAASEYGASTSSITNGTLTVYTKSEENGAYDPQRLALIPVTKPIVVESEKREPGITLLKPEMAEGLFALMYRQEDSSAAGDRVDGLVSRIVATLPGKGMIHDGHFRQLRQEGVEWSGIDPAAVTAALPLGLDGTAFFPCAPRFHSMPDIRKDNVTLIVDSVETVAPGVSNVSPASGDRLHATLIATIRPAR